MNFGFSGVGRKRGHFVDGIAVITSNVIAGAIRVANLLPTGPTHKKSESRLSFIDLLTTSTVKLICIAWDTLLALTKFTRGSPE